MVDLDVSVSVSMSMYICIFDVKSSILWFVVVRLGLMILGINTCGALERALGTCRGVFALQAEA